MEKVNDVACERTVVCACGFFGHPSTKNMCSVCFKKAIGQLVEEEKNGKESVAIKFVEGHKSKDARVNARGVDESQGVGVVESQSKGAGVVESKPEEAVESKPEEGVQAVESKPEGGVVEVDEGKKTEEPPAPPPNPSRCFACKKRIGLTGFKCRCGNFLCATHRYWDQHACTFDYRNEGKQKIAKANPVIKAKKLDKI